MDDEKEKQSASAPTVLLLGANGFIGSYVLNGLLAKGARVIGVRRSGVSSTPIISKAEASGQLQWRVLQVHHLLSASAWSDQLAGIDVVINCVGILRQRIGESYEDVHHLMPKALAEACAKNGTRLLQTSALGLHDNAKSRFLSSKWRGERAIEVSGADYCIVRPSLIDGLGGFGASWLRMLASWPVHLVPRGAVGKLAAVQANDLGEAYTTLAFMPSLANWRQANLGGTRVVSYAEYLQLLRGVEHVPANPRAVQIFLPNWMNRVGSHLCDVFRFSPFSYGHWILLQRDNLPLPNALPELLGRAPTPVSYTRVALRDDFRLS